jgi:hypothetical protein
MVRHFLLQNSLTEAQHEAYLRLTSNIISNIFSLWAAKKCINGRYRFTMYGKKGAQRLGIVLVKLPDLGSSGLAHTMSHDSTRAATS